MNTMLLLKLLLAFFPGDQPQLGSEEAQQLTH